jgi:tetratricopeptide (TPR) repeat protein
MSRTPGPLNRTQLHEAFVRGHRGALAAARLENPRHAPSHLFLGIALYDAGNPVTALACFDEVLRLQPYNELAAAYRGLALLAAEREQEGLALFRQHGFSDNHGFLIRLTEWVETQWLETGRFFSPKPLTLDAAPAHGRRSAERRATRAFQRRDWVTVVTALDPFAAAPKPDIELIYAAALASELLHDYERALGYLARLTGQPPAGHETDTGILPDILRAVRARNLVRLRRFREAAEDLDKVLIIGPEDFGVNYYLGILCLAAGQRARAREMFGRAYRDYLVDTLEYQFTALTAALLSGG